MTAPDSNVTATVRTMLERKIVEGELQMPVLSTVVTQVIELTRSMETSGTELSELIHGDQALAAHLLRVANSPLYLPSVQIVSLQQAISRLGMRVIADLAVALAAKSVAFKVPGHEDEVRYLWRRAAAAGAFAREIGRMRRKSAESALLCGLLQNVGFPILLQTTQEICDELGYEIPKEVAWSLAEEYHATVGARMAGSWGLPDLVVESIYYHHMYAQAPQYGDDARVAILADALAGYLLDDGKSQGAPQSGAEAAQEAQPALSLCQGDLQPGQVGPIPDVDLELVEGAGGDAEANGGRPVGSESGEDVESGADVRRDALKSQPAFGELDLYPDDVDELLSRSDDVRETMELFV